MATYLFEDIEDFQKYVGGAANNSLDMRSLKPWIKKAFDNHVSIWLGPELWAALVAAVDAGSVDPASDIGKLLPLVCSPLAMLTMYEYSFIGGVQFGEAGIFRTETEEMKSPYKYQEANYRESMLNNGYEGIEEMQSFLDANAANYGTWSAKDRSRELLINYAADLRTAYSKYISRYTFEIIRSVIEDVELFALVPNIGQAQYDAIKAALLAGNPTDAQKALLKVLRKVVGNFAIKEGILRQWVLLDGRSVVQNLQRSIDARQQAITPESGSGALSITVTKADEFANRYIAYLEHFLTENIGDYPLYQEFIDAQAAAAAAEAEAEIDERQGDHCCNSDYSSPDVSGRRGIVPL